MKKIQFNAGKGFYLNFKSFIQNFFLSLIIFSIASMLILICLEIYAKYYYSNLENNTTTATNMAIYNPSLYRSRKHKPNSEIKYDNWNYIKINTQWLREDKDISTIKTKKRYLMLGDSFTFWMGVNQNEAFPQVLQKKLGIYHTVINGGIIGQSIDDAFMYLKNDGIKFNPDFVIFNFFVGNDITEIRRHKWTESKNWELEKVEDSLLKVDEKNRLRHREKKMPKYLSLFWLKEKWKIIEFKYFGKIEVFDPTLTWPIFLPIDHKDQDKNILDYWTRFEKILNDMNNYCKKRNIKFIVTIIPMDVQISKKYWKKYPWMPFDEESFKLKRPQQEMLILGKKYNIPVIDFLPLIQEKEKTQWSFYFKDDPHFNRLGHLFAASFIWDVLMNNYLK